jgi:N-acyl-D-amino-acid deacylase
MKDGAFGLSTGLFYVPAAYAKEDEVVRLAQVAARYGGIYATHMRTEGPNVQQAIAEALRTAQRAGIPLEISHLKLASPKVWGKSDAVLAGLREARAAGTDVTVDVYPYTAASTSLSSRLPNWALEGGLKAVQQRLRDPEKRSKISAAIYKELHEDEGYQHLDFAVVASASWDRSLEGKNLRELNRMRGRKDEISEEIETLLDLLDRGDLSMVYHLMDENDLMHILASPISMIARDGGVQDPNFGKPHPRSYGTAARVLGRYVRERQTLGLEDAIRKLSSFPAERVRLNGRGFIREGFWADIVVFDPNRISDASTFEDPHQRSRGIEFVAVNGDLVIQHGQPNGRRPGHILYGPGTAAPATQRSDASQK